LREDDAILKPFDFIKHVAESRKILIDSVRAPENLVVTYQRHTFEYGKKLTRGKPVDWWPYGEHQPFCIGRFNKTEVGVSRLWMGAAAAVMTLEELIACGAKRVFEVGLAGGLQTFLQPGNVIVVTEAIRDEGASSHYFSPRVRVESSRSLRDKLAKHLNAKQIKYYAGSVWSTDGVYRETIKKFRRFRDAGALCVDMETSAVFAVAKYRKIEAASAMVVSDVLSETGWLQAFEHESVIGNAELLLRTALEALTASQTPLQFEKT
jgi:uridine phosphorylase